MFISLCSLWVSVAWEWNSIQNFIVIAKPYIGRVREYSALARINLQWNPKRELMCEKEFFAFLSLALLFLNVTVFHSCSAMIYAIFIFSFYLCHFSLSWEMHLPFRKKLQFIVNFCPFTNIILNSYTHTHTKLTEIINTIAMHVVNP